MYGSDTEDPIVRYYDETLACAGESEITWYVDKVKTYGGPVLDLACGTGRIALLLAQKGFSVVGIDLSEGMLNLFKEKLHREPEPVRDRVVVQKGSMSDFHVDQKFGTVVCCDAFFHNVTVEQEIGCLTSVAAHVKPGGRVLFNIPSPDLEFLLRCAGNKEEKFRKRGEFPLKSGGRVVIEESSKADIEAQTIVTTLRYTAVDSQGVHREPEVSSWKIRYLYMYEAVHLLYRCGFEVESIVGDYSNGPVTRNSQLIFQATLVSTH
jgi:SAM-dependent methyltransferase